MGLEAIWQQITISCSQVWTWLKYETGAHPFLAIGSILVIVLAWGLYKMEVRERQ